MTIYQLELLDEDEKVILTVTLNPEPDEEGESYDAENAEYDTESTLDGLVDDGFEYADYRIVEREI